MSEDNTKNLVWFFAGAAIGASIALLYAPASGADTRRYLGRKANEGKAKASEAGRDLMERGREMYDKGRKLADEAAELFESGKKMVDG